MSSGPAFGAHHEPSSEQPVCPRHPDRVAYVRCQRCERPVCPDCQRPAQVGVLCVDCVKEHRRSIPREHRPARFTDKNGLPIPLATYIIIGLTLLVYGGQWAGDLIPGFPNITDLFLYSPLHTSAAVLQVPPSAQGVGFEPWRMLTSALVHSMSSPLHFVLNMAVLWMIGRQIEQFLGAAKFVAIYVLSALGGAVAVLFLAPANSAVVGASGAVYGLFAALWLIGRRIGADTRSITILIVVNFAFSFMVSGISWQGHLGGFLTGLAASAVIVWVEKQAATQTITPAARRRTAVRTWLGLGLVAVVLIGLTFIGGMLIDLEAIQRLLTA